MTKVIFIILFLFSCAQTSSLEKLDQQSHIGVLLITTVTKNFSGKVISQVESAVYSYNKMIIPAGTKIIGFYYEHSGHEFIVPSTFYTNKGCKINFKGKWDIKNNLQGAYASIVTQEDITFDSGCI